MAARKNARAQAKVKRAPARKQARRKQSPKPPKKAAQVRKKVAKKKAVVARTTVARSTAARTIRRKPAAGRARAPEQRRVPLEKVPVQPASTSAAGPALSRSEEEVRVGIVTHYFSHLSVAVVQLESGELRVGDEIRVRGHTTDFRQRITSLEIAHEAVPAAGPGDNFGLKVIDHARENDVIYKVISPSRASPGES